MPVYTVMRDECAVTDHETPESLVWPRVAMPSEVAGRIESIRAVLAETERPAERDRRLPHAAVAAMAEQGLFAMSLPAELAGWEAAPVVEMEVVEAIARVNTSAAWCLMVGSVHTAYPAVHCSQDAVKEIFDGKTLPVAAGQMAPIGQAHDVDGGMVVTGRYSWGSGIWHADWVIGGCRIPDSGSTPETRVWTAPRSAVAVEDNWDPMGLAGSGSSDYSVTDLFIPDGWWFSSSPPVQQRGGNRYRAPLPLWSMSVHMGLALGAAERILQETAKLATVRRRRYAPTTIAERGVFQHTIGRAYVSVSACRAQAISLLRRFPDYSSADQPDWADFADHLGATLALVNRTASEIAVEAFTLAGGAAVGMDSPIQRVLRDLLVAQQHIIATEENFERLGLRLTKQWSS